MPFRDLPGVTQCRFKRGERLISAGERVEYVYYLLKGTVYRVMTTDAGFESILSSKTSNNIVRSLVGILILYRRKNTGVSNYDFVAYNNCLCYRIPTEVCRNYLRQNPDLLEEVARTALDEYNYLLEQMQAQQAGGVGGRVCAFLLEHSYETDDGWFVSKKHTNVEIAKFLSVHKVTVARVLHTLKEEQAVARTEQGLLLSDIPLLEMYATNKKQLKYK